MSAQRVPPPPWGSAPPTNWSMNPPPKRSRWTPKARAALALCLTLSVLWVTMIVIVSALPEKSAEQQRHEFYEEYFDGE